MGSRDSNRTIATDTMNCIRNGFYTKNKEKIELHIEESTKNTLTLIPPYLSITNLNNLTYPKHCNVSICNNTTIDTTIEICRQVPTDKILILNFASARKMGGGFLNGSTAQEESIMRATTAYATLEKSPLFYNINRRSGSPLYTDTMVYSSFIEIFKNDKGEYLDKPLQCSLLTVPAVNAYLANHHKIPVDLVNDTMSNRIFKIIDFAYKRKFNKVILGAFGCGVFKNNPKLVADSFNNAIRFYDNTTKQKIDFIFAIYDKSNKLINTFKKTFNKIRE